MKFINQIEPWYGEKEAAAVYQYMQSGGWLTEFKQTEEFEKRIADFLGVDYAVVVTSGTVALYLAIQALGIGPGDSVVVPDYTMIATPNAVKWAGADVILADVERDTMCLDLSKVQLQNNTKAVMYVPINGRAGNLDDVVKYCQGNGLHLIEDACQSFGSRWRGRYLGTFGDVGVLSFTPHKIITTGQGGAVVTNRREIYEKVKQLKDFHRTKPGVDVHTGIGYNFKFTDLQAVIGIEQLKTIDERIRRKSAVYKAYREGFADLDFIEMLPIDLEQTVPWVVDIILRDVSRDQFISHLKDKGIGSRPFYPPIHTQAPYASIEGSFETTSEIAPQGLWLPSSIGLSEGDLTRILDTVNSYSDTI